jgi:hypothetical protein
MRRHIPPPDVVAAWRFLSGVRLLDSDILLAQGATGARARMIGNTLAGIWFTRSPHLLSPRKRKEQPG